MTERTTMFLASIMFVSCAVGFSLPYALFGGISSDFRGKMTGFGLLCFGTMAWFGLGAFARKYPRAGHHLQNNLAVIFVACFIVTAAVSFAAYGFAALPTPFAVHVALAALLGIAYMVCLAMIVRRQ